MARLSILPINALLRDILEKDKLRKAIQFLKENPKESPTTAIRAYGIRSEDAVRKAWRRERKRIEKGKA
jgi:hypothetical protein